MKPTKEDWIKARAEELYQGLDAAGKEYTYAFYGCLRQARREADAQYPTVPEKAEKDSKS